MHHLEPAEPSTPTQQPRVEFGGEGAASRTTTSDALLGLLSIAPMTGYEIREMIGKSIGNFWSESFGQIYPALKRLVEDGLAEVEEISEPGRPRRKLYRLTDDGRDRLIRWLAVPARTQVPRNELLLKIFFGHEGGPAQTAAHLRSYLAEQGRLLGRYHAIKAGLESEQAADPAMPYWRLPVLFGLRQTEARIAWAEDGLRELQALDAQTPHNGKGR